MWHSGGSSCREVCTIRQLLFWAEWPVTPASLVRPTIWQKCCKCISTGAVMGDMKKAQEALADVIVEGAAGGGLVKVSMSCRNDVKRVTIDPSLLEEDKDMLEDLLGAAVNDALRKAEATAQEKMSSVTAGMPLPPGMKLPF